MRTKLIKSTTKLNFLYCHQDSIELQACGLFWLTQVMQPCRAVILYEYRTKRSIKSFISNRSTRIIPVYNHYNGNIFLALGPILYLMNMDVFADKDPWLTTIDETDGKSLTDAVSSR